MVVNCSSESHRPFVYLNALAGSERASSTDDDYQQPRAMLPTHPPRVSMKGTLRMPPKFVIDADTSRFDRAMLILSNFGMRTRCNRFKYLLRPYLTWSLSLPRTLQVI